MLPAKVFHHALENLKRFEWRGNPFRPGCFRIAANLISDRWRRKTREPGIDDPEQVESIQAGSAEFEEVERKATLFRLVNTLPTEQRRVVVLRFVEEKSIKEVAREITEDRRRGEAIAVPGADRAARQNGGCRCLSAL